MALDRHRRDFDALFANSLLSVSQAGYNTVVEGLWLGKPMVLVPFETASETEQRIRAERLASLGLAEVVLEKGLTASSLARAIDAAIRRPKTADADARPEPGRGHDHGAPGGGAGAARSLGTTRGGPALTGWPELAAALDAIAGDGKAIRVWWRDDDAGRDHPNLERLLALALRHGLPVALAVVPLWLEAAAQARIAASAHASVLQHGFAHRNHAPAGRKSCELGGRAIDAILAELAQGRATLVEAFGASFLAVLVPPWNRIDPQLTRGWALAAFAAFPPTAGARRPWPLPAWSRSTPISTRSTGAASGCSWASSQRSSG